MASPAETLNDKFDAYVRVIERGQATTAEETRKEAERQAKEIRAAMFPLCQAAAKPIRRRYTAADHVNGDLFDDAVQDVFLKLTSPEKVHEIKIKAELGSFTAYFLRAVNYAMIDVMRKVGREKGKVSLAVALTETNADFMLGRADPPIRDTASLRARVLESLDRLPPATLETFCDHLEGIIAHDKDGRYQALADTRQIPLATVNSRLHRARAAAQSFPPLLRELAEYAGCGL